MNRPKLICVVAFSIGLFFTLITVSFANTGTFIVDKEIVEEVTLGTGDIISGNVTALNGTVNFYLENPMQEIIFSYNKTEFRDFNYTSTSDGNYRLHFINSNNSSNLTVMLKYSLQKRTTIFDSYTIDFGGIFSFIVSSVIGIIILKWRLDKRKADNKKGGFWELIKDQQRELGAKKTLVWLIFVVAGLFALWLTTRQILRLASNYLLREGYRYNQFEILSIVAYALTINLVFTLLDSLYKAKDIDKLDFTISATIQAVLIGVILLLPRYGEPETINRLGANGFAFILISMSVLLAALVLARRYLKRHSSYATCYI